MTAEKYFCGNQCASSVLKLYVQNCWTCKKNEQLVKKCQ